MTKLLLKRTENRKLSIHPFIQAVVKKKKTGINKKNSFILVKLIKQEINMYLMSNEKGEVKITAKFYSNGENNDKQEQILN